MERIFQRTALFCILFFSIAIANSQKPTSNVTKQYPNLILKVSYQNQLQAKVKEIQKKGNPASKLPGTVISSAVLKNVSNAADFIAAYKTKNIIVGPMFLPTPYLTYLRIGEYRSGIPPVKDQVVSTLFNETEQSCLMSDKDFTNIALINSALKKDIIAAWEIETVGAGKFKISTTGQKKYLSVKGTGVNGSPQVILTNDKNEQATNWIIFNGKDEGITFYNSTYNIFLGRRVEGRVIFLVPFSFKDYGNEALQKTFIISWDLYRRALQSDTTIFYEKKHSHSMRYMLSSPLKDADGDGHLNISYGGDDCDDANSSVFPGSDADGDGHVNTFCGGDDCDDTDASRYPGATEICDANGNDEDCNYTTFGNQDNDRDGYMASTCFNIRNGVITSSGNDCDDNNPAIYPGQQIWVSETRVDVCGTGLFDVEPGFIAVRQPNGTAIVQLKK